MAEVVALRGGHDKSVKLPGTSMVTQAELKDRLEAQEQSDAQQANTELVYRGYALFGLLPDNYQPGDGRAHQVEQIAGAYFPKDNEIVLVDRGAPLDSEDANTTFAHELVHALQASAHDLTKLEDIAAKSGDAWLALRALTEGEATLYELLMQAKLESRQPSDIYWSEFFASWQQSELADAVADTDPLVMAALRFPYAFGAGYVTRRWLAHGQKGIDALYDHPPTSTHQVLFGDEGLDLGKEREDLGARAVPELDGTVLGTTSLGAWHAALFFAREARTQQALWYARDVLADEFSIWHDETNDLVSASWRVRWPADTSATNWLSVDNWYTGSLDASDEREAFLIASEGELPSDAGSISWRQAMDALGDAAHAPSVHACVHARAPRTELQRR